MTTAPGKASSRLSAGFRTLLACPTAVALLAGGGALPAAAGLLSWTPTGPDGAWVHSLAADPVHPGVFYAAALESGLFASRDGGATWVRAAQGLEGKLVLAVAVDPTSPNRLFAATDNGGLYVSTDSAVSWSRTTFAMLEDVATITVSARDGTVYAGGSGRFQPLWISRDSGGTWSGALESAGSVLSFLIVSGPAQETLYAATSFGDVEPFLRRSRDGGRTWTGLSGLPLLPRPTYGVQLAGDPSGSRLFVSATLIASDGSVLGTETLRSTDGGDSWQPSGPGGAPLQVAGDGTVIAGSSRSLDGGDTWSAVPIPPQPLCFTADPFAPATLLAGVAWGGIYRSADDGASWQPRRQEISGTYVRALAAGPHRLWAAVAHGGLQRASTVDGDAAIEWVPAGQGLPAEAFMLGGDEDAERDFGLGTNPAMATDPRHPHWLYFAWPGVRQSRGGTVGGGVARSRDGGGSFEVLPTGTWANFVTGKMVVDPFRSQVLYQQGSFSRTGADHCEVLRSSDFGATWSCINPLPPRSYVFVIAVVAGSPGTLYAAGQDLSDVTQALRIWRSQNRGTTWSEIPTSGLGMRTEAVLLVSDPNNPSHLYLDAIPFLYSSSDRGATWRQIGGGLPSTLYALTVDPSDSRRVYALGTAGLFASHDSGASFAPLSDRLPAGSGAFSSSLVLDPADPHRVFVALGGLGVWAYTNR
jgi:hypothetical protein